MTIEEQFLSYLEKKGYATVTPSGRPSTVYDYGKRIERVCEEEKCSWEALLKRIDSILPQYEIGGVKEDIGSQSHSAVRCALRQFQEFSQYLTGEHDEEPLESHRQ